MMIGNEPRMQGNNKIMKSVSKISSPNSWKNPLKHWQEALTNPYYYHLVMVRHHLHNALNIFFEENKMIFLDLPLTTRCISSPMGLGSDSTPVAVSINGKKTYLADSMQFLLEFGCRVCKSNTAYKMISFRGENSDNTHLSEFQHAECEILGALPEIISIGSNMVHFITKHLADVCFEHIELLCGETGHIKRLLSMNGRYPILNMESAMECLTRAGMPYLISMHESGLFSLPSRAGEAYLSEKYADNGPLWLTHFPYISVPFYQAYNCKNKETAENADLILGGRETIGAGQRHLCSLEVTQALKEHSIDPTPYDWYIRMKDLCKMQTSGLGLGVERYLMWLLNQDDIRNCTLLYRDNRIQGIP